MSRRGEKVGPSDRLAVVAVCDACGAPIRFGNRPDGTPNGLTLKDCLGVMGNDLTLCADCVAAAGAGLLDPLAVLGKRSGANGKGGE